MSRPPAERPRRPGALMAYQAAVILPFLAFAVWAGWREPGAFRSPMLLLWLVAIAIVDLMPLTFGSNLHFSLSFPLQLAVALVYPAHVAGAVTFLGTSDPRELRRELSLVKALFIRAQIAVSVVAEGWIFHALADIDASWYVKTAAVALATVVGYSVNVVLVAWFVRLASPEPTRGVIREMHRGILGELVLSYMGLALFGVVIATFFVHEGVLSIVVFIAPLVFARQMMTRTHSLKKATDELEAQRGELADIIANTSDGIFTVGMDGLVATWNPAMERITGFAADEAIGRDLEALIGRPLDLVQSEQGSTRDGLIRTKPGAERWMRYTVNPVPAVAGGRRGYVVVARDVTAQLATERLQAEFVSTVSHELRTPLTPLKGFLSALVRRRLVAPEAELHEYYEIMLRQTTRLERLIGELLDTTQIQSGSLQVRPETVDLSALVAEEVQMCSEDHPDRTITGRVEPATLATADPIRVSQVLANLLSNAVKYSPPGSTIEVGLVRERERAVAWVRDHGPGIPASERERVFDRFHRIDNGTTRTAGGTGLGLYIARQLVQAMGGLIWVRSSPGAGSTFSFSLPLARTRRDPAPVEESVPTAEEVPTAEAVLSGVAD